MLKTFKAPDYTGLARRRINRNPQEALRTFETMKAECFGFAPTVQELAQRLLGKALAKR